MTKAIALLALMVPLWSGIGAAPPETNAALGQLLLQIDPSSMPMAGGKVTLTIGVLRRTNGVFSGEYKISVTPYFFKNERGLLAIRASDETLALVGQGKVTPITGTATTLGNGDHTRAIQATATPAGPDRGTLRLWFMAGDRKMTFEPAYQFTGPEADARPAREAGTRSAALTKSRLPASHREAAEASARRPKNP